MQEDAVAYAQDKTQTVGRYHGRIGPVARLDGGVVVFRDVPLSPLRLEERELWPYHVLKWSHRRQEAMSTYVADGIESRHTHVALFLDLGQSNFVREGRATPRIASEYEQALDVIERLVEATGACPIIPVFVFGTTSANQATSPTSCAHGVSFVSMCDVRSHQELRDVYRLAREKENGEEVKDLSGCAQALAHMAQTRMEFTVGIVLTDGRFRCEVRGDHPSEEELRRILDHHRQSLDRLASTPALMSVLAIGKGNFRDIKLLDDYRSSEGGDCVDYTSDRTILQFLKRKTCCLLQYNSIHTSAIPTGALTFERFVGVSKEIRKRVERLKADGRIEDANGPRRGVEWRPPQPAWYARIENRYGNQSNAHVLARIQPSSTRHRPEGWCQDPSSQDGPSRAGSHIPNRSPNLNTGDDVNGETRVRRINTSRLTNSLVTTS